MNTVIRIKKDGGAAKGLTPCSVVPVEDVLSGEPNELGEEIFETKSQALSIGTWECTPYAETLAYPGETVEFCYVLKGKVALTNPDGSVETFEAGDGYIVPAGFKGRFEVLETLRKIYVIYSA